jgi:hypothetical protein
MTIRNKILGDNQSMETMLASAIKTAQAASAALEGLTLSLMLMAAQLHKQIEADSSTGCSHINTLDITTMSDHHTVLCEDCGETIDNAMDHE